MILITGMDYQQHFQLGGLTLWYIYLSVLLYRFILLVVVCHLKLLFLQVNMLRFHGSYQLDQMDNREVLGCCFILRPFFISLQIKYHPDFI
jgi:hypothetical protein